MSKQILLNPEFSQPNFIPDKDKEYFCYPNIQDKGFNYLHSLVLGGKSREAELEEFIKTEDFEIQNKETTKTGWTALMLAAMDSNMDSSEKTVELLIPVSDANLQDEKGWTALMLAVMYSNNGSSEKTVELLIRVSNANLQTKEGWTALLLAVINSSSENIVEMLISVTSHHIIMKIEDKEIITKILLKENSILKNRLSERETVKNAFKEKLNLEEGIILAYI